MPLPMQANNASLEQRQALIAEILLGTIQANWSRPGHLKTDKEMAQRAMSDMGDTILQFLPSSISAEELRLYLTRARRDMLAKHKGWWPNPAEVVPFLNEAFAGYGRVDKPRLAPRPQQREGTYKPCSQMSDEELQRARQRSLEQREEWRANPCRDAKLAETIAGAIEAMLANAEAELARRGL